MLITLKNKDRLSIDDFTFKCSIGRNGLSKKKKEGDFCTPKGTFSIKKLYYRADRIKKRMRKIKADAERKSVDER